MNLRETLLKATLRMANLGCVPDELYMTAEARNLKPLSLTPAHFEYIVEFD